MPSLAPHGYPLGVAVNLSVRNLMDERIVGDFAQNVGAV